VSAGRLLVDLHCHTDRSYDARNRLADYERAHAQRRVDVVAITDHNTIAGAVALRSGASFPVIVGQEIDTADGELIGLFLEQPIPAGLRALDTAERIRAQGGLVYLQHPFYRLVRNRMGSAAREELRGRGLVDIVEAANGGPFTGPANARALAWARACGLPHAAASDAHEPAAIGTLLVSLPDKVVDARSLPALLRAGTVVDRRPQVVAAIGRKAVSRAHTAIAVGLRLEPLRRRRP